MVSGWILEIWDKVKTAFTTICGAMQELETTIDEVSFTQGSPAFAFMGTVHYLLGDLLYTAMMTLVYIGVGFMIYKLGVILIEIVISFIPGLRGKIVFR